MLTYLRCYSHILSGFRPCIKVLKSKTRHSKFKLCHKDTLDRHIFRLLWLCFDKVCQTTWLDKPKSFKITPTSSWCLANYIRSAKANSTGSQRERAGKVSKFYTYFKAYYLLVKKITVTISDSSYIKEKERKKPDYTNRQGSWFFYQNKR